MSKNLVNCTSYKLDCKETEENRSRSGGGFSIVEIVETSYSVFQCTHKPCTNSTLSPVFFLQQGHVNLLYPRSTFEKSIRRTAATIVSFPTLNIQSMKIFETIQFYLHTISRFTNKQESERIYEQQRTSKDFERNKMEILFISTFKICIVQILWIK